MPDLLALNGQIIGGVPLPAKNYVKLWENPDPTVSFGAQTITLNSDDYDFLLVTSKHINSGNRECAPLIIEKGSNGYITFADMDNASSFTLLRAFTRVNDTSYTFSVALSKNTNTEDNTKLIPTAVYGIKKDALATEGGGVGGGHIIEDAEGTDLDQQDILQFKGTLRATNDAQNGKTIIDDSAVEIEWDDWQAMTEAQREAYLEANPKVDILNFPDASGEIDVELFTKLWENPNPTAAFAAQDITLASDDYDFLMWVCTIDQLGTYGVSFISRKGSGVGLNFSSLSGNNVETYRRMVMRTSDTEFTVNTAVYNINGTSTQNNGFMIPHAIYGFKKKVTVGIDAIAENVRVMIDYSTEERIVGKWIDGSDLYEKTVTVSGNVTPTSGRTSLDIDLVSGVNECISTAGFVTPRFSGTYSTVSWQLGWNSMGNSATSVQNVSVYSQSGTVRLRVQVYGDTTFDGAKATVTLRYTKI